MPRRKYTELLQVHIRRILSDSTMSHSAIIRHGESANIDDIPTLSIRIKKLMGLIGEPQKTNGKMIFFVMYDIESDKVRAQISKYLLHEGCLRVQKSVFLGDLPFEKMEKIMMDLTEVQSCYENNDSIMVIPVSSDHMRAMRIIGKEIDTSLITKTRRTLFF